MLHHVCNVLVHVMYSGVSGQCSHTIPMYNNNTKQYLRLRHFHRYCIRKNMHYFRYRSTYVYLHATHVIYPSSTPNTGSYCNTIVTRLRQTKQRSNLLPYLLIKYRIHICILT